MPPVVVLVLAWMVPGLAHFVLGRRWRGLAFFGLLIGAFAFGCWLGGAMPWDFSGAPTRRLATLGVMGLGIASFVARLGLDYDPDPTGAGYEYGAAFILTAGLMNILLLLDAWDITWGKEAVYDSEDRFSEDGSSEDGASEDGSSDDGGQVEIDDDGARGERR